MNLDPDTDTGRTFAQTICGVFVAVVMFAVAMMFLTRLHDEVNTNNKKLDAIQNDQQKIIYELQLLHQAKPATSKTQNGFDAIGPPRK